MKCCEKCFQDTEVIARIRNIGEKGDCDICHRQNVFVYNTEKQDVLKEDFESLITLYKPASQLSEAFPLAERRMLSEELRGEWNIFDRALKPRSVYSILTGICHELYSTIPELFDTAIGLDDLYKQDSLEKYSLLKNYEWDEFVRVLKMENRFHTNHINLEKLEKYCKYMKKVYKKGTCFYRCRISDEKGYLKSEMKNPPSVKTAAGRANSKGIPCLYLSDSEETTIHEVRAGELDYVTIGRFDLLKDITIVDLRKINQMSPFRFLDDEELLAYAINRVHFQKIASELSKTVRRSDTELDYLATQYIADFIKSIKYNGENVYYGIEYESVMHPGGYNLAVFWPDVFSECIETKVYKIEDIQYRKCVCPI